MTAIVLERESDKLADVKERVEVRDSAGNLLGYFSPRLDNAVYYRIEVPECTEEDLRRAEDQARNGQVYTTAQVLAHLKSLEDAENEGR